MSERTSATPAHAAPILPFRIGHGYDLHRLEPIAPAGAGRPFVLAGVRFDHDRGPVGHSDGDAVFHAVTDALLGAVGLPDIGQLFPDNDPRWDGADSAIFLAEARDRVAALGWRVANLDVTVICERPKLGARKREMIESLARVLGVAAEQVNLKGKTHERVDAVGEGRAIEVHAVLLLSACSEKDAPGSRVGVASQADDGARRDYSVMAGAIAAMETAGAAKGTSPSQLKEARLNAVVETLWNGLRDKGVSWLGFYLDCPGEPDERRMVLGPREPKPACSPIGVHGVCGQALLGKCVRIVRDVAELGSHYIACDPRDRSEIVVPLLDDAGRCWAVLDVDSHQVGAFDEKDAEGLRLVLEAAGFQTPAAGTTTVTGASPA